MMVNDGAMTPVRARVRDGAGERQRLRTGVLGLLAIKDIDIRITTLEQCRDAVDKCVHAGGAFSAVVPLVSLYYGGFLDYDVEDPTRPGQDLFVLSKGHAVAAMASVYADLGYFDRSVLVHSRSHDSILNGHPGPILPGVHISTGPLGQGLSVAQGFAIAGKRSPRHDVYCVTGDGELQEGLIWEAVMYSAHKRLDNLCVLVDHNGGQLDVTDRLIFPMPDLAAVFRSFGWQVHNVDSTSYDAVCGALESFKYDVRNGKPTAIICNCAKGQGGFSKAINTHKATLTDAQVAQEMELQLQAREARVAEFSALWRTLDTASQEDLAGVAAYARLLIEEAPSGDLAVKPLLGPVATRRVPPRDKRIRYDAAALPKLEIGKQYSASGVITAAMKVFARDSRVASIDADLASTSGLEAGVGAVDQGRALNVGVAEANMMNIGEAFAALGSNVWISTFCPFFDWKVLRRIAIGHQERLEAMESPTGWLSEGHGLDLTMIATASNFETRTNGATHMGNDDANIFDGMGQLKIIDVSCPRQMLGVMKWIMEGGRGLVYARVLRAASAAIYGDDFTFEFGKGYTLRESAADAAVIVTSGRGVYEALAAADLCAAKGVKVGVVDMPSIDEALLLQLAGSGKLLCIAEQNNGYIWQNFVRVIACRPAGAPNPKVLAVNALGADGRPQFIHSATYDELLNAFGLSPAKLAEAICQKI